MLCSALLMAAWCVPTPAQQYTICGTGLDTVPYPGDIGREQLVRIFGDVASLAKKWSKPLAARVQPVPGKAAGELSDFNDPHLFNTRLHAVP